MIKAELVIDTRAFLNIEYQTPEILALQARARKDFLRSLYLESSVKSCFWPQNDYIYISVIFPAYVNIAFICHYSDWNKEQTLNKKTTKIKGMGLLGEMPAHPFMAARKTIQ